MSGEKSINNIKIKAARIILDKVNMFIKVSTVRVSL